MRCLLLILLLPLLPVGARADWGLEWEGGLTNAAMELQIFTQLFWAVHERCEATYSGDAIVTNWVPELGTNIVATNRLYGVEPIEWTNTWLSYDYSEPTNVVVTTNVGVNMFPHQVPWELARDVLLRLDALIPHYVDTSADLDEWFSTPIESCTNVTDGVTNITHRYPVEFPRWSRTNLFAVAGLANINERRWWQRQPPRATRAVLAEVIMQDSPRYTWLTPSEQEGTYTTSTFVRGGPYWYSNTTEAVLLYPLFFAWAIGTATPPMFEEEATEWASGALWEWGSIWGLEKNYVAFPPVGDYVSTSGGATSHVYRLPDSVDRFPLVLDRSNLAPDEADLWVRFFDPEANAYFLTDDEVFIYTNTARLIAACGLGTNASGSITIQGATGVVGIETNIYYTHARYHIVSNQSQTVSWTAPGTQDLGRIWHDVTNLVFEADGPSRTNLVYLSVEVSSTNESMALPGIPSRQVYRESLVDAYKIARQLKATAPPTYLDAEITMVTGSVFGACSTNSSRVLSCTNMPAMLSGTSYVTNLLSPQSLNTVGEYGWNAVHYVEEADLGYVEWDAMSYADSVDAGELVVASARVPIAGVTAYSLDADNAYSAGNDCTDPLILTASGAASVSLWSRSTVGSIITGLTTVARLSARELDPGEWECVPPDGDNQIAPPEDLTVWCGHDESPFISAVRALGSQRSNARYSSCAVYWGFKYPAQ